jgi:hypothetical protein
MVTPSSREQTMLRGWLARSSIGSQDVRFGARSRLKSDIRSFRQPCFSQAVRERGEVFRSLDGKPIPEIGDA